MSLKNEINKLLDDFNYLCADCSDAKVLEKVLSEMKKRLNQPLRIAVSGIMKAGKSTFMNALMGERLVYTGTKETTYTVCWFKYGEKPHITICFRDGSEEDAEFDQLEKWSIRAYEAENPRINDVRYLIIHYPNELFKKMEFIDTPGMNSQYKTDAENTLNFLDVQASKETLEETSMADAIVYAFQRSAGNFDADILKKFQEGSKSSPINSVGILTRVDAGGIWEVDSEITPVEAAMPVAENTMKNETMKNVVFTTFPVCAKQVEGMGDLNDEDWNVLKKLSSADKKDFLNMLYDAGEFKYSEDEPFSSYGSKDVRGHIIDSIGLYGIVEICEQLSKGIEDKNELKDILEEKCGIKKVREMILSHFGNRTFLIKTQFIFNKLKSVAHELRKDTDNVQLRQICNLLDDKIDELMSSVQTLNELRILQYYYNGQLQFVDDDEKNDFLHITGEYGREPENRLGISESMTLREMMCVAKEKSNKWNEKASDFLAANAYVDAASTIARSYQYIHYHLSGLCDE